MTRTFAATCIFTLTNAVVLSACTLGAPYATVRKDEAIFDRIRTVVVSPPSKRALACVRLHGTFTRSGRACFIQRRGECIFLVGPNTIEKPELIALCNGWEPYR